MATATSLTNDHVLVRDMCHGCEQIIGLPWRRLSVACFLATLIVLYIVVDRRRNGQPLPPFRYMVPLAFFSALFFSYFFIRKHPSDLVDVQIVNNDTVNFRLGSNYFANEQEEDLSFVRQFTEMVIYGACGNFPLMFFGKRSAQFHILSRALSMRLCLQNGFTMNLGPFADPRKIPDRYVLIMNHRGFLDNLIAMTVTPLTHRTIILMGDMSFATRMVGPVLRKCAGVILFDRFTRGDERVKHSRRQMLQDVIEQMTTKENANDRICLIVYPEGKCNHENPKKLSSFHRGAFIVSYLARVPIVSSLRLDNIDHIDNKSVINNPRGIQCRIVDIHNPPPLCDDDNVVKRTAHNLSEKELHVIDEWKDKVAATMQNVVDDEITTNL
jgi:hypothetical protein